jgi:hypothetical protein
MRMPELLAGFTIPDICCKEILVSAPLPAEDAFSLLGLLRQMKYTSTRLTRPTSRENRYVTETGFKCSLPREVFEGASGHLQVRSDETEVRQEFESGPHEILGQCVTATMTVHLHKQTSKNCSFFIHDKETGYQLQCHL